MPTDQARRLLVVGAAAGMGYWLCEHLFPEVDWASVYLVDTQDSLKQLHSREWAFRCPVVPLAGVDELAESASGAADVDLLAPGLVVCFAVPRDALATTAAMLLPAVAADAAVAVVTHTMSESLRQVSPHSAQRPLLAVHPLFEANALSLDGQTVYVANGAGGTEAARGIESFGWLDEAIERAGGIVKVGTAQRHDAVMAYVQGAAHQSLLTFADAVLTSGLDLEDDVWAARTPLFESLFGLAARVLERRHQSTIADIQVMLDSARASDMLAAAATHLREATDTGDREAVGDHLAAIREHFGGTFFETVRAAATTAVTAAQSTRTELARCRRTGELVGIRPVGRDDMPRVGRIVKLAANEVTLRELLVGKRGSAALLDGPGEQNARRHGFNQKPRDTVFALGHVELVVGAELEHELENCLTYIRRDIRFLVPESVAGNGVLTAVAGTPGTRGGDVVSEAVRTGQRSVVIGIGIRIDHSLDEMTESLRRRVEESYAWPKGIARPATGTTRDVAFLGPSGTFSEVAARQGAHTVGLAEPSLVACESFDAVLARVSSGSLAVLPITSSSSGLVSRAAVALLEFAGDLAAGGVVDVAVRFDAYVRADAELTGGATLYSHPQAIAQCGNFIRRWGLAPTPCESTAEALRLVAVSSGPAVALAGEGKENTADGVKLAEREVDDLSGSITRFLIVGRPTAFGAFTGGSDPTVRSIAVSNSTADIAAALHGEELGRGAPAAAFDEILTDAAGRCLWVTSRVVEQAGFAGKVLGRAPWSPRTPVVRVELD